jgi:gas vesicle protein
MFASKAARLAPLVRQSLAAQQSLAVRYQGTAPGSGIGKGQQPPAGRIDTRDPDSTYDRAAERASQTYDDAKSKASQTYEEAKSKGSEFMEKVKDKARDVKEAFGVAKEKAQEMRLGKDTKYEHRHEIREPWVKASEKIQNTYYDIKDRFSSDRTEDARLKGAEQSGRATQKVSDMAEDAKEKLSDTYESAKDNASYQSGRVTEKVKDMASDAKEKLSDTYESAKDNAYYQSGRVTEKVKDLASDAKEKLSDTYETMKEKAKEAKDTISKKIKGEE